MTSERLTVVLWDYDINTYMFWLYTDMYTVRWTFWTALLIVDILQLFSWTQRAIINHHVFKATVSLLQNILYRAFDGFLTLSPLPISLFSIKTLSLSFSPTSFFADPASCYYIPPCGSLWHNDSLYSIGRKGEKMSPVKDWKERERESRGYWWPAETPQMLKSIGFALERRQMPRDRVTRTNA